jgi:hypothetical protein
MKSIRNIIFLWLFSFAALAQEITDVLMDAGFEQVHYDSTLSLLFWENRLFRNPYHSLYWARTKLSTREVKSFGIVYMNRPIGVYNRETFSYRPLNQVEKRSFRQLNRPFSGYRWSFRISPDFVARFGDREAPFKTRVNGIIDTRVFLLPGFSVQTGVLIPLQNNLAPIGNHIRLSPSHLHYFINPLDQHFFAFTLGTFFLDRYGVDMQYRYANFNKPLSIGAELALTGYYFIPGLSLYTEPMNDLIALVDAEYRWRAFDLTFKLTLGQFIGADRGARLDFIKQYGDVDIGLFLAKSINGTSAGFQFAFPLFPGKIARGKRWEIRTTEEFRWEYNYTHAHPIGRTYRLGMPRLSDQLRQFNSSFIQNQRLFWEGN